MARPTLVSDVPQLPPRPAGMHKGQAGRVAVIAGSRGMSGAAVLSGLGALRGGAGLVRVCCPASVQPMVAASEPCLMTTGVDEDASGRFGAGARRMDLRWATVHAIGPGMGVGPSLAELLEHLLGEIDGPVVLDADGLNNLALLRDRGRQVRRGRPTIVTPHPGEMARLREALGLPALTGDDDDTRVRSAHEYATRTGFTVALKGYRTVVAAAGQAYINNTGNPGMASGGMGDVLTGLTAALVGQGLGAFDAARLGVYVHGLAADHCARQIGPVGYLARDVAEALPAALNEANRPRMGFGA